MGRVLFVSSPSGTWRTWIRAHLGTSDLLLLNPADAEFGPAARLTLFRDERPVWTRFYGSLDARRSPHVLLAALSGAMARAENDVAIVLPAYRPSPVLRQTFALIAELTRPDAVMVPAGTDLQGVPLPVAPTVVDLEATRSPTVQAAQRKAQWIKLIEECSDHEVDLRRATLEGTRLGTGTPLPEETRARAGLADALYAETTDTTLLIVAARDVSERTIARALDVTRVRRAVVVTPALYEGLLCAFARSDGEEIGMGYVTRIDFANRTLHARCTAVPPVAPAIVRLGSLRIDGSGRELGEIRPWQG